MSKLTTVRTLKNKLKNPKGKGSHKVVFTNGCFDILHAGHVRYLNAAKKLGDVLVVGLNSDKSVKKIKGKGRPIVPERERAEVLSGLESVNHVVLFSDDTPYELIKALKPDILVKGADWKHGEIVGEDILKEYGGKVRRIRLVDGKSTTNIIKKIVRVEGQKK